MKDKFTFRDKIVIELHKIVSNIGLHGKPKDKFGVSFLIACKDSEEWIQRSILSVINVADEVIVVDGSVGDKTEDIVKNFHNSKIRYFKSFSKSKEGKWGGFVEDLNFGLRESSFRWVFKWDADMVAEIDGLTVWYNRLKSLNPRYFYEVDVARVNPCKELDFGGYEGRLFTKHNSVNYTWVPDRDSIVYPFWYRLLRWNEKFILHLNPK
jgi:glycosyltransferase involved in cell wall biosynthesis